MHVPAELQTKGRIEKTATRNNPTNDGIYARFSSRRKLIIVGLVSFYGFLSPFSSTTILAAIPQVAASFKTTGAVINISKTVYLAFMGLSAPFWAPLSQIYGRRLVRITIHPG